MSQFTVSSAVAGHREAARSPPAVGRCVPDDESAALSSERRLEMPKHHKTGVVSTLKALQVEQDLPMTALVEGDDGAGQQVGALHGQMPADPDRTCVAVDDLREEGLARHGAGLRCVAWSPEMGAVIHRKSLSSGLCGGAGTSFAVA
jgi:hypothetical protein